MLSLQCCARRDQGTEKTALHVESRGKRRRLEELDDPTFLTSIRDKLLKSFDVGNPTRPQYLLLNEARLRPALLRQVVRLDDCPEPGKQTYGQLMRECVYVNSVFRGGSVDFTPEVSQMQMLLYSWHFRANSDIAFYLFNMLNVEIRFTWESFENFHAYFEALRYHLLRNSKLSLLDLYPNALLPWLAS